ncbi:MAG: pyrC [Herbinix sp.]|jgi:dihydroorotase|nr:pyrC [Herbinix sp.]
MLTLIKKGYVIDPASGREGQYDLLIDGECIRCLDKDIAVASVEQQAMEEEKQLNVIDAEGMYVMPGFIDLHVHLREPGFEYKETIASGARAAAAGGYTTICPMPNTNPATDCADMIKLVLEKAEMEAVVNILPVGAITIGQSGSELADIKKLKIAGAVALSEDGKSVMDTALYMEAMHMAAHYQIPIFAHCEDKSLVGKGVINAGDSAIRLGLPGISNAVEDIITARDILMAKESGAQLHLCHISTKDSAKMLELAKKEGIPVTGEVCPHHFILSDEDIKSDDADYKMNPPLRKSEDIEALKKALKEGVIDVIATDHAPHSNEEKAKSFMDAPFGIVGLETAFSLTFTELVQKGYLTITQLVEKMSVNPAKVLGIDRGCIEVGKVADLVIADPKAEYLIDKEEFRSKGKNTPFHGRTVRGRIISTFVAGNRVYHRKE